MGTSHHGMGFVSLVASCFQMKLLLNLHAHPLQMPVEETKYNYGMLMDILTNNFKPVKHLLFTNIDESHNVSMF